MAGRGIRVVLLAGLAALALLTACGSPVAGRAHPNGLSPHPSRAARACSRTRRAELAAG